MRKHYVVPLEKKPRAKCRVWQLRVDSGRKTPSGAISWKTRKVSGKTWTQANEMCEQWAADLDEGRAVAPVREWTFGQYREHWIGAMRDVGLAPGSTVHLRECALKAAGMHLDRYRLADLTSAHVDAMTAAAMRGETPSGRPASGTYAAKIVESVRLMLDSAVRDGLVAGNVARLARKPAADTAERRPVTMGELSGLSAALDPADWHERAVLVLAETGMRLCELVPMTWGDWDEAAGLLRVPDSKNANGLRYVPVTKTLSEVLSVSRFHLQLELGEDGLSDVGVIADDAGAVRSAHTLRAWWRSNRVRYGLPGVGLHQLRHAMVTNLLASGASLKEAQDIIGDKTGSVVLGVYAHTTAEQRSAAMQALDDERRRVQDLYKIDGSGCS